MKRVSSNVYFTSLFVLLILLSFGLVAYYFLDAIIQILIYLLAVGIGMTQALNAGLDINDLDIAKQIVPEALQALFAFRNSPAYILLVTIPILIVSAIILLFLAGLVFMSARRRFFYKTQVIEDNAHPALLSLRETMKNILGRADIKFLRILKNSTDSQSFAELSGKYIALNLSDLRRGLMAKRSSEESESFSFLLFHELSHLLHFDPFLKSFFLNLNTLLYLFIPALFFRELMVWLGYVAVMVLTDVSQEMTFYIGLLGLFWLVKCLIAFRLYRAYIKEFHIFKEYEADLFAFSNIGKKTPLFLQNALPHPVDKYHPAKEDRISSMQRGQYFIDVTLFFLLPLSWINLTGNEILAVRGYEWLIPILLLVIVGIDRIYYRKLTIFPLNFRLLILYLIASLITLLCHSVLLGYEHIGDFYIKIVWYALNMIVMGLFLVLSKSHGSISNKNLVPSTLEKRA